MEDQEPTLVHDLGETGPQTPLDALRAKRDEIETKRDVLIPVVGYEEIGLKAKYRLIERVETDAIARKVRKQAGGKDRSEFMFRVLIDTIIAACEGFYLSPDESKNGAEPLMNEAKTAPIGTYIDFAQELSGREFLNHRQAVLYVFGGNEFAVGEHGLVLNKWLGHTNLDIDSELLEG